jgi:Protein of unknown function (DUF2567)
MSTERASAAYPEQSAHPPPRPAPAQPWFTSRDLGPAAVILVGLAAAGALLGLLWQQISPRTQGFVYVPPHGIIAEESESLIASDGRFVLLTCAAGVIAAAAAWSRRSARGPAAALALAAGGLLGALLTDRVGHATGGGHDGGTLNEVLTLSVRVHARGLLLLEPAMALLVYAACALFARRDDLGADIAFARLVDVWPAAGAAVEDWMAVRRIDVTLDRALAGSPDWLAAYAARRADDGYDPLPLEPPAAAAHPDGAVTYSFTVADVPGEPPLEILVQPRLPYVDASALEGRQWAFTVIPDPGEAP